MQPWASRATGAAYVSLDPQADIDILETLEDDLREQMSNPESPKQTMYRLPGDPLHRSAIVELSCTFPRRRRRTCSAVCALTWSGLYQNGNHAYGHIRASKRIPATHCALIAASSRTA